jgi:hypothetical protein
MSRWPHLLAGRATDGTFFNRPVPAAQSLYVGLQRPCRGQAHPGMLGAMAQTALRPWHKTSAWAWASGGLAEGMRVLVYTRGRWRGLPLRATPPKAFRGLVGFSSAFQTAAPRPKKFGGSSKKHAGRQKPEVYVKPRSDFC